MDDLQALDMSGDDADSTASDRTRWWQFVELSLDIVPCLTGY